jgi:hypothetical protein
VLAKNAAERMAVAEKPQFSPLYSRPRPARARPTCCTRSAIRTCRRIRGRGSSTARPSASWSSSSRR